MLHLALRHGVHIGQGLVGADGVQGHGQGLVLAGLDETFHIHAGPQVQVAARLQAQVHRHRAAAGRGTGVDAHHLGLQWLGPGRRMATQLQLGRLADLHLGRVVRGHLGLQLQRRQVDHLDHGGLDIHALTVLHHALRDLTSDRAAQHGVVQVLAGAVLGGARSRMAGLCGLQVGQGGGQRRIGDETARDQGAVVVVLALCNRHLGLGGIGLQLGLAKAGLRLGRVHAGDDLALHDRITLAHVQFAQLPRHTRLDHGAVHSGQAAGDGHPHGQRAGLDLQPFLGRDGQGGRRLLGAGLQGGLPRLALFQGAPHAPDGGQHRAQGQQPPPPGAAREGCGAARLRHRAPWRTGHAAGCRHASGNTAGHSRPATAGRACRSNGASGCRRTWGW